LEGRLKIVLVHNTYQQPGGEDIVFEQECRMLEQAGHQVVTYCRSNWDAESYRGIRLVSLAKRTVWASDTRKEFKKLLQREKPDIVHVHNTFVMISPSIYSACYEAKVPVVHRDYPGLFHGFVTIIPFAAGASARELLWADMRGLLAEPA